MEAIRSGHISSPLNSVVSCYGAQGAEAAIRGMYYAGRLERRYGLRFTMASAMENNTLPLGLSSIWAGSGARYSWKGTGGYGSQLSQQSMKHRRHQLYRYTGPDGSGVIMKWYALAGFLGGYAECRVTIASKIPVDTARDIVKVINRLADFCDTISPASTYPFNVAGAFGFGHDNLDTYVADAFSKAAKEGTTAARLVRVSNEEDFFKDIAQTYPSLPSRSVSYGNEWDLLSASMNETTAEVRRATEKLRTAEALSSIVALKAPAFADRLLPARNAAWDAFGLYWEHNWTADGPIANKARGAWQNKVKDSITGYVDSLYNLSVQALGSQLKRGSHERFFVFNPLGWIRNDVADIAFEGSAPVHVTDVSTGKEVPLQVIKTKGRSFIRIAAAAIPSVGYKLYEIKNGAPAKLPPAATVDGEYISNSFYKIRLTRAGVITAIMDKKRGGRQWVTATEGRYVNDLGGTDLDDGDALQTENAGPVSVTLKATSNNPVPHTVRLTLFANSSRIEIENSIDTNFSDIKTWAFSFAVNGPTTTHEELGAILTVKKEGRGGQYSGENARYDWQSFNHFADISNRQYGITISNLDCSFFKLGKSSLDSLWEGSSLLSALAGGQIDKKREDGGVLGIHHQMGQTSFHYHFALRPHAAFFTAAASMKFSMEHQNPLATGWLTGGAMAGTDASFSLLQVNVPHVLLWTLKPSEEGIGSGLITRFWNVGAESVRPAIKLYKPIAEAWQTTHIETNEKEAVPVDGLLLPDFKKQQLKTYRLLLRKK